MRGGRHSSLRDPVRLTGVGSMTVTVGLPAPNAEATIRPFGISAEARTIIGSYLGSAVPARDIPKYAQLWRERTLPVEALISSLVDLEDTNEAMANLADGKTIRHSVRQGRPAMTGERTLIESVPTGLFIGGEWREAADGKRFGVEDPSTGQQLTTVADASAEDATAALDAAVAAQGSWAATPPRQRVDDGVEIGPLIDEPTRQKVDTLVQDAIERGATALTGGAPIDGPGYFYPPTVLTGVASDSEIVRTEIFGPVAAVMTFRTEDEAVELANATPCGLIAYAYTRDLARSLRLPERLQAGMLGLNSGVISNPAAPFGGTKQSGLGREGGSEGIGEYLETMYVGIPAR